MNDFQKYLEKIKEIGHITAINQSVICVSGLPGLRPREMVITGKGEKGIVQELDGNMAKILMFSREKLEIGERAVRTNNPFQIPVSQELLGRIVDPLCRSIDGLGPIPGEKKYLPVHNEAPGITKRARVKKPLETGVMAVDLLVPIGHGQRELIIGDSKTGKTTFLLQTMVHQAKKKTICIYVGVGKEVSDVKTVENYLKKMNVFHKTVMVIAFSENPSGLNYLAPFSGMTIAEYFRDKGENVVIILDDLTSHAKYYREIYLLMKMIPGRDSYPGNIFHFQATLIERAGNIKTEGNKEISITALPVAQTLENNISGYIQTNLLAMCDGHIFFDMNNFRKGQRPAINAFLSVSRVGNQTKNPLERNLANWIRKKQIEHKRAMEFSQFGVELSQKTQKLLDLGEKLEILFNQGAETLIPRWFQLFFFSLFLAGFWADKPKDVMKVEIQEMIGNYDRQEFAEIENQIKKIKKLEELKSFGQKFAPKAKQILYF